MGGVGCHDLQVLSEESEVQQIGTSWDGDTGITPKTMAGGDFPMCASIAFPPGHPKNKSVGGKKNVKADAKSNCPVKISCEVTHWRTFTGACLA